MTIYAGDRAPKAYQLVLEAMPGVDFTAVTGWALAVERPDGTKTTWTADASDVTTTAATLTHVLAADGSDFPIKGPYDVHAVLTLASGQLRSDSVTEFVQDEYAIRV